jgi:hypothetical protein
MLYGSSSKNFAYFFSTRTEKEQKNCLSDERLSLRKDFKLGIAEYEAAMLYQCIVLFSVLTYLQENQP